MFSLNRLAQCAQRRPFLLLFTCIAILEFNAFAVDAAPSASPSPEIMPSPSPDPAPVAKKRMPPKFDPKLKKEELLKTEEAEIPEAPTAPPRLVVNPPKDGFECPRKLIYEGKEISCDSYLKEDGERLRPIVSGVPAAVREINQYQFTKRRVQNAAYVGTLGAVMVLVGIIAPKFVDDSLGSNVVVRNRFIIPGAAIMLGSLGVSLYLLHENEKHIGNAVEYFNRANPENPIQLLFTTGVSF